MSEELKSQPEDIVRMYDHGIKRHHGRGAFILNFLRRFPNRPSEIRNTSESEIRIRHETAGRYAADNLPALKTQAAEEARAAGKETNPI